MMRYLLLVIVLACAALPSHAQLDSAAIAATDSELLLRAQQVDSTYKWLKDFRDVINDVADRGGRQKQKERIKQATDAFLKLYDNINTAKITAVPPVRIQCAELDSDRFELDSLPRVADTDLTRAEFKELLKQLDAIKVPYTKLVVYVHFEPLNSTNNKQFNRLIEHYNKQLKSVGRRMGRVLQQARNEDDDYFTQDSHNRLSLAMYELSLAQQHILLELHRFANLPDIQQSASHTATTTDNISTEVGELRKDVDTVDATVTRIENALLKGPQTGALYVAITADTRQSIGAHLYGHLKNNKGFAWGGGLGTLYTGDSNSVAGHAQVGAGKGLLHAAIGALYDFNSGSVSPTGTIYVINKPLVVGLGVSQQRVMVHVGLKVTKP